MYAPKEISWGLCAPGKLSHTLNGEVELYFLKKVA